MDASSMKLAMIWRGDTFVTKRTRLGAFSVIVASGSVADCLFLDPSCAVVWPAPLLLVLLGGENSLSLFFRSLFLFNQGESLSSSSSVTYAISEDDLTPDLEAIASEAKRTTTFHWWHVPFKMTAARVVLMLAVNASLEGRL